MTMSLVEHGSKTKKVKILSEMPKNPENKRQELLKQEEEKLKVNSFSAIKNNCAKKKWL